MALETHSLPNARAGIAVLTFAVLAVLVPTREVAAVPVVFSGTSVDPVQSIGRNAFRCVSCPDGASC